MLEQSEALTPEALLLRGRVLVMRGLEKPTRMIDFLSLQTYWAEQRRRVAYSGRCDGGCRAVRMYEAAGQVFCPHTMRACPQQRLSLLISFFQESKRMADSTTQMTAPSSAIVPKNDLEAMIAIDQTSRQANHALLAAGSNEAAKALITARAMGKLTALLSDEIMQDIMPLQNSILGFKTDKPDTGYPLPAVRNCVMVAMMRGLRITGNEFNIIGGNLYVTKEGYDRLLFELDGFANFRLQLSVPKMVGDGAVVSGSASWRYRGDEQQLLWQETPAGDYRIPIRVNKGMGVDAILGKARSKAMRQIYAQITGSVYESIGDVDGPPDEVGDPS